MRTVSDQSGSLLSTTSRGRRVKEISSFTKNTISSTVERITLVKSSINNTFLVSGSSNSLKFISSVASSTRCQWSESSTECFVNNGYRDTFVSFPIFNFGRSGLSGFDISLRTSLAIRYISSYLSCDSVCSHWKSLTSSSNNNSTVRYWILLKNTSIVYSIKGIQWSITLSTEWSTKSSCSTSASCDWFSLPCKASHMSERLFYTSFIIGIQVVTFLASKTLVFILVSS